MIRYRRLHWFTTSFGQLVRRGDETLTWNELALSRFCRLGVLLLVLLAGCYGELTPVETTSECTVSYYCDGDRSEVTIPIEGTETDKTVWESDWAWACALVSQDSCHTSVCSVTCNPL